MTDLTLRQGVRAPVRGQLGEFWAHFSTNRGAVLGLAVIVLTAVLAMLAPMLAAHSPYEINSRAFLLPPAWETGGSATYLLGTDPVGRDMLSRILHGGRLSLGIALTVVAISCAVGVLLGLAAGFLRGGIEVVIVRAMDIILALPGLLLALVIVAILGPGLMNAMLAVSVVRLPHFTRITRAAVIQEMSKDYVLATRLMGASRLRLMFVTVLPNCLPPIIVQATFSFSTAILDAAALGFLGMGAQAPSPEWGSMLADAREFITRAWWVVTLPGLAILLLVFAINLVGDGIRDALDPKLKVV